MAVVALLAIAGGAWFAIGSRKETTPPPFAKPPADPPTQGSVVPPAPGSFSLSIAVHPFAEVVRITRDGEPVTLEQKSSPLLEAGLRVGAYEVVLRHPKLGEKTVKLAGERVKAGKTYVIWGRMDGAPLNVDEAP